MIDATIARREVISDEELLVICLKNAPEGTDKKQVMRLIKHYENAPNFIVVPLRQSTLGFSMNYLKENPLE